MQTGLIFKPEKERPSGYEEYLRRQAIIAARVSRMQVDAEFEKPDSPWIEFRDTITNYGVRYNKGKMFQRNLTPQNNRQFIWQRPKPLRTSKVYEWKPSVFYRGDVK